MGADAFSLARARETGFGSRIGVLHRGWIERTCSAGTGRVLFFTKRRTTARNLEAEAGYPNLVVHDSYYLLSFLIRYRKLRLFPTLRLTQA